ncbi:hypothetical protein BMS3Bbin10_02890 [bacterium BMS3Bbin10]|nr:hypothetical protein BMS3Bbin10_02890 [bacterium BMS3Bbin10]
MITKHKYNRNLVEKTGQVVLIFEIISAFQ